MTTVDNKKHYIKGQWVYRLEGTKWGGTVGVVRCGTYSLVIKIACIVVPSSNDPSKIDTIKRN